MSNEEVVARRYQQQLDTEALKIASKLEGAVNIMSQVLTRHLDDCMRRADEASKQRGEFRQEMSKALDGIASKGDLQHAENRSTMSTMLWAGIGGMGTIIMLLLATAGYLFIKANNW